MVIQGHHGGLTSKADYSAWKAGLDAGRVQEALRLAARELSEIYPGQNIPLPRNLTSDPLRADMFLRFLFSVLVDADFLDTERHFWPGTARARSSTVSLANLLRLLERYVGRLAGNATGPVAEVRREVFNACVQAAQGPTGVYRLAAPTGAGKTLASMAFALRHALQHGLARVIVAVPFISITEQTAQVLRDVFEPENASGRVVLEHHSGVTGVADDEAFQRQHVWSRLAAENWDAPIIVTTTVQLFESLFANRPSRCRRVHRLARSVIIIDEAQALPAHLLRPILDALRQLCEGYGTTVLLSTATQPAFHAIREFSDVPGRDILPAPAALFRRLKRVRYDWQLDSPVAWEDIAEMLRREKQSLAVVNTKGDAIALLEALRDPDALHLSTLLCGAHRRNVIDEVRARLADGRPCRLVSTQVIEAGVDVDFPFVMRALGPLDSIIQAAGRCNREGRLDAGRVVVFLPAAGGSPSGPYRIGIGITRALLAKRGAHLDDPALATEYFRQLFQTVDVDRDGIQKLREGFDFAETAGRFRMIDDETESVVITTYGSVSERKTVRSLLARAAAGRDSLRLVVRELQPYMVTLRAKQVECLRSQGFIREVAPGLSEWLGEYDATRGLVLPRVDVDSVVV